MYQKLNLIAVSTIAFVLVLQTASARQAQPAAKPAGAAAVPDVPGGDRLTPSELEELLGPIALYPDALLANVLAASVYPDEVAEAAKWAASGGKADEADAKKWEDPVKAVAKIPDAIKMMGDYPDWTIALGQAYLRQAKDVMDVVQTLRKKAQENGALKTTPQQEVVVEQKTIYIKSVDPQIIYVPVYQPTVVYAAPSSNVVAAGVIGFGVGVAAGLIIANNMDCNWHGGYVGWGYGYHGGGYHGGYYGGHNDVNINRGDININGDVNIGSNNGNNIGNGSGNRVGNGNNNGNNIGSGNNNGNRVASRDRVGNEGNAWAPDRSKSLATSKPNEASKFKGGANAANRPAMPSQRPASGGGDSGQRPAAGGGASGQRPASGGGVPTQRPAAGGGASGQRPAAQPSAKPSMPPASARPPAAAPRPAERPSATPRPSSGGGSGGGGGGGAFSGGSGTKAASQRGAASRGSSGGGRSGGGGGGGGRTGGGGGGRGR